ncbi:MAG: ATP-binding protein [Lachnospiraceae bacterium]|nr:ATP-binding protein [Lachnospiraceae bacterium]
MSYSSAIFRNIMQEYEDQRRRNESEKNLRLKEIYQAVPGYKDIDDRIADISTEAAIDSIQGDDRAVYKASQTITELSARKKELLKKAGYSEDYTQLRFRCPDCQDTGYTGSSKCHCLKQKLIDASYRQSDIYPKLNEENFDTFSFDYFSGETLEEMKKIYKIARHFTDTFANTYTNMLFYGNVGSGKTFVSNCIAHDLIDRGFSVIYLTSLRLFELLNARIFRRNDTPYDEDAYNDLFKCSLLIIDDLGTEVCNSASNTAAELFQILNERDISHRSTIISSNLSLEQLRDNYSERSLSRILGGYELILFNGNDIRLEKRRRQA